MLLSKACQGCSHTNTTFGLQPKSASSLPGAHTATSGFPSHSLLAAPRQRCQENLERALFIRRDSAADAPHLCSGKSSMEENNPGYRWGSSRSNHPHTVFLMVHALWWAPTAAKGLQGEVPGMDLSWARGAADPSLDRQCKKEPPRLALVASRVLYHLSELVALYPVIYCNDEANHFL